MSAQSTTTFTIFTFYCLLLKNAAHAVHDYGALEYSDQLWTEPGYRGDGNVWRGSHSWMKHLITQLARADKEMLLQILYADKTKQEITNNLEDWVRLRDPHVQIQFAILKEQLREIKEDIEQCIDQSTVFSEDAKSTLQKVRAVMDDMTITPKEETLQLRDIISEATLDVRREIRDFIKSRHHFWCPKNEEFTDRMSQMLPSESYPSNQKTFMETGSRSGSSSSSTQEEDEEAEEETESARRHLSVVMYLNDLLQIIHHALRSAQSEIVPKTDKRNIRDTVMNQKLHGQSFNPENNSEQVIPTDRSSDRETSSHEGWGNSHEQHFESENIVEPAETATSEQPPNE